MRVAGIEEFGGGGVTVLEVADPRAPRTGEVLIEVKAAGVGNWDEFARTGRWDLWDEGRRWRSAWRRQGYGRMLLVEAAGIEPAQHFNHAAVRG